MNTEATPPGPHEVNQFAAPTSTENTEQRTSKKAIFSLVCGLASFVCNIFTAIPGLLLGILALREIEKSGGRLRGMGVAIGGIVCSVFLPLLLTPILIALLLPAVYAARNTARDQVSMNNLRHLALAMMNYESATMSLPGPGGGEGNSGLSWRVRILPFIEERELYQQFHRDEPWDSEHNKTLIDKMPDFYGSPTISAETGKTVIQVPVGNGAMFDLNSDKGPTHSELSDGSSNTIMIVEVDADEAVVWTKPDDWEFDPAAPKRGLGKRCRVCFADGHAEVLPVDRISAAGMAARFTRAGSDPFDRDEGQ